MITARETATPVRPFLDWRVTTDPAQWAAEVAVVGIQHSEPYAGDPRPNDQARAPDAVRLVSKQFCYGPEQWDFDFGGALATALPVRCVDCVTSLGLAAAMMTANFVTASLRQLWRQGAQVFVLGGDHGVTIPVLDALDAGERYILHIDASGLARGSGWCQARLLESVALGEHQTVGRRDDPDRHALNRQCPSGRS
jgi:agmatinase